jgi:hypothetical protein
MVRPLQAFREEHADLLDSSQQVDIMTIIFSALVDQ